MTILQTVSSLLQGNISRSQIQGLLKKAELDNNAMLMLIRNSIIRDEIDAIQYATMLK